MELNRYGDGLYQVRTSEDDVAIGKTVILRVGINSRSPETAHRNVVGRYHLLPLSISKDGIEDDCDDAYKLKCAFNKSPRAFCFGALGFCLYAYGYLSAKLGSGTVECRRLLRSTVDLRLLHLSGS